MCGLMAVYNSAGIDRSIDVYMSALRTQSHRGPDDEGSFLDARVFLGFQRLSILDLSDSGHQPMVGADEQVVLTFNGQIYNYIDLREELLAAGYIFKSTGDTEVVLNAYLEWGDACFEHMRGMWAIVIWDARTQQLVVSRDRIGQKPLHYARDGSKWVFASECKTIRAYAPDSARPDPLSAYRFVAQGWQDFNEDTFFSGIKSVAPGTVMILGGEGVASRRFWSLNVMTDPESSSEKLWSIFSDTVARHLQSDVPVALSLSGGVDSTAIACTIAKHLNAPESVHAFSVCPPDAPDESPWIDATIRHTGIKHTYIETQSIDYAHILDELLYFNDAPIPKVNQMYQFLLRREVGAAGYKVMLGGEGADETLGGYARYAPMYLATLLALGDHQSVRAFLAGAQELTGQSPTHMLFAMRAYLRRGVGARTVQMNLYGRTMFDEQARVSEDIAFPMFKHEELSADKEPLYFMKEMLDRFRLDVPYTLRIEDRNSMAHSLELRSPFVDHVMVEAAYGFAPAAYMYEGVNKRPFRDAVDHVLTPEVQANRQKMRRPGSDTHVVYDHLANPIRELLRSDKFKACGFFADDLKERFEVDMESRHFHNAFVWFRAYLYGRFLHLSTA